jgi:hypothetical protein
MSTQDAAAQAQAYNASVIAYESLDREIDQLLAAHGGASKNLSDTEFAHYRELVELRDLAYNKMKTLAQGLLDD